jgi:hypothetical protein
MLHSSLSALSATMINLVFTAFFGASLGAKLCGPIFYIAQQTSLKIPLACLEPLSARLEKFHARLF